MCHVPSDNQNLKVAGGYVNFLPKVPTQEATLIESVVRASVNAGKPIVCTQYVRPWHKNNCLGTRAHSTSAALHLQTLRTEVDAAIP